jgi:hypothetical protein
MCSCQLCFVFVLSVYNYVKSPRLSCSSMTSAETSAARAEFCPHPLVRCLSWSTCAAYLLPEPVYLTPLLLYSSCKAWSPSYCTTCLNDLLHGLIDPARLARPHLIGWAVDLICIKRALIWTSHIEALYYWEPTCIRRPCRIYVMKGVLDTVQKILKILPKAIAFYRVNRRSVQGEKAEPL